MKRMSLVPYLGLYLFGLLQADSKWLLTEWGVRHSINVHTFWRIRSEKKQERVQQLCHVCRSVYHSTTTLTLNRCSWNFMLGALKIPNTYQLLINYTIWTGCFLLGECGLGVKLTTYLYMWQVNNAWNYTSTLPYVSQDRYLSKRSDKFITQEYTSFRCFRTVNEPKLTLMNEIVELSHVLSWK